MKKFNPDDFTNAPRQLQKSRLINASKHKIWPIVADHKGMASWMPMIKHVDLVKQGVHKDWGDGCERHCQFGPDLLEEKIVFWDEPNGYAYQISDMHLVKNHLGYISLESKGDGTQITWTQYFKPNGNFVKQIISKHIMMPFIMSRALANLERKVLSNFNKREPFSKIASLLVLIFFSI
ncbi:MAG: SRPBCC family protein [Bacteroidota bacterium]